MKKVVCLCIALLYAGLHLGCTCDCEVCTTRGDFENCGIEQDVPKAECKLEPRCVEEHPDVTCSAGCL